MKTKIIHTVAPWTIGGMHSNGWINIRSSDSRTVAEILCQLPEETEANARLISAAPDLLEAAQDALRELYRISPSRAAPKLRAAIAKATEKTP